MTEQELRSIVRAAVARQLPAETPCAPSLPHCPIAPLPHSQVSHLLYTGLVNVSDDCVIEPAVKCDHCGYCKSQGY